MDKLSEKKLTSKKIYDGRVIKYYLDTVELPDGNTAEREIVRHQGGVCVAALDDDKKPVFRATVSLSV